MKRNGLGLLADTSCQCSWQVVYEAIKATTAFLVANEKESHVQMHLKDLLPAIIQVSLNSAG